VRWTEQFLRGVRLLRENVPYRTFVLTRLSLMVAQMAVPFYIVYAKDVLGIPARMVGVYLTARTATSILSNLLWGRISDRRGNRHLIRVTNVIGLSVPLAALLIGGLGELVPSVQPVVVYLYAFVFVATGALGAGSSIGNINYLLEIAPAAQRPLYLGFTNTLFGLGVLASSLGGLIADWAGFRAVMLISAAFYALALGLSLAMIEPRELLAQDLGLDPQPSRP
jgi:MFS family permease